MSRRILKLIDLSLIILVLVPTSLRYLTSVAGLSGVCSVIMNSVSGGGSLRHPLSLTLIAFRFPKENVKFDKHYIAERLRVLLGRAPSVLLVVEVFLE